MLNDSNIVDSKQACSYTNDYYVKDKNFKVRLVELSDECLFPRLPKDCGKTNILFEDTYLEDTLQAINLLNLSNDSCKKLKEKTQELDFSNGKKGGLQNFPNMNKKKTASGQGKKIKAKLPTYDNIFTQSNVFKHSKQNISKQSPNIQGNIYYPYFNNTPYNLVYSTCNNNYNINKSNGKTELFGCFNTTLSLYEQYWLLKLNNNTKEVSRFEFARK